MTTIGPTLDTERLSLRVWEENDRDPFAAMCADPEVMEFFPKTLTREESDVLVSQQVASFARVSLGMWAVRETRSGRFVGAVGLVPVPVDVIETWQQPVSGTPVEVGWRLARWAWGLGYATEAANASCRFGFDEQKLDEIVSFTAAINLRSQAVMTRIGMARDPKADFRHPRVNPDIPLSPHVLFRLPRHQ